MEEGAKLFLMLKKPGSGATPSTSSTPSSIRSTPQTPVTFLKVPDQETLPFKIEHDPTGFWEKLSTFLKRHFTEKDALKVLQAFKKVKPVNPNNVFAGSTFVVLDKETSENIKEIKVKPYTSKIRNEPVRDIM